MNANELMIGDFIRLKESKNIVVVEAIDYDGNVSNNHVIDFFFCEGFCSGEKRYNYAPDCFEPIPLTREILEKNGWFYPNQSSWMKLDNPHRELWGCIHTDGTLWLYSSGDCDKDESFAEIEYVHELQHCLKLVGIDKEITI